MVLLPSVQDIVDVHCRVFYCFAYSYIDICCYLVDVSAQEGGKSGCASCASHRVFVDGMFSNAMLCKRGAEWSIIGGDAEVQGP